MRITGVAFTISRVVVLMTALIPLALVDDYPSNRILHARVSDVVLSL